MLRVIALSQIVGGVLVVLGYRLMLAMPGVQVAPWLTVLGLLFGSTAIVAGILLLGGTRLGVPLSVAVQALQVVALTSVPAMSVVALAGPKLRVIMATTGVHLRAGFGGEFLAVPWARDGSLGAIGVEFDLGIGYRPSPLAESTFTVALNVASVIFLAHLLTARRATPPIDVR